MLIMALWPPGRYGNVVLADDDLNILAVVQKGKVIHDNR